MSLCAIKGMLIFYRFCIIKEQFRDFTNPGNYYDIPTLRSLKDPNKPMSYDFLHKKYLILHQIIGFHSNSGEMFSIDVFILFIDVCIFSNTSK